MSDIVTGAGLRVVEEYGKRQYTLRPPSYGEAGELAARHVGTLRPGPAMVAETVRQALESKLGDKAAAAVAAVSAHEEAEDAVQSVLLSRPMESEPPAAHAAYRADLRDAQRGLLAAERRRAVAEHHVATDPAVVEMRAAAMRAQMEDRTALVSVCLVAWTGAGIPPLTAGDDGRVPPEQLHALPAGDLNGLADRCNGLLRPDRIAEKN